MSETTKIEIGGWADAILNQDNEHAKAHSRHEALFLRLGKGFYNACTAAFTPEERKLHVAACELLATEIQRVINMDSLNQATWELAYLEEARNCGVDSDLIDSEVDLCAMRDKLRVDAVFHAKVIEYALVEGKK